MMHDDSFSHMPQPARDREVIRVDCSHDKMGIAASLRQAFEAAAHDQSDHDFDQLLRDLH
jgi:hypothetical protein